MTRLALKACGAPVAHGPDHDRDRARRRPGHRRLHAGRHDRKARRLAVHRRLRRHRRRRHRPAPRSSVGRDVAGTGPTLPASTLAASGRCPASASPPATSPTRPDRRHAAASRRRRPVLRRRLRRRDAGRERSPRSASTTGRWATGAGRGRDRRRHRASSTSRSATRPRSPPDGPRAAFNVVGIARFGDVESLGTATRGGLRPARRAGRCSASAAATTTCSSAGRARHHAGALRAALASALPALAGPHRARPTGPLHARRPQALRRRSSRSSCSPSASSRCCRRVHDLQHAVDHRRPAHARAGAAAHDRRLAPPGPALVAARGAGPRRAGLGGRHRRRLGLASGLSACSRSFGLDLPSATCSRGGTVIVSLRRRHRSYRCSPPSSRRCGRPASRRSPRCARARGLRPASRAARPRPRAPSPRWSAGRPRGSAASPGRLARRNAVRNPAAPRRPPRRS